MKLDRDLQECLYQETSHLIACARDLDMQTGLQYANARAYAAKLAELREAAKL